MSGCTIKQLEERHMAVDISYMLWNEKMDLLAIANVKGEVSLHRLIWPKVWTLAPANEGTKVAAMAWRPDGKVLAVAYETGNILLVDIENKNVLHSLDIDGGITCVKWIQEKVPNKPKANYHGPEEETVNINRCDKTTKFLSKPSQSSAVFTSSSKTIQESNDHDLVTNQTELNLLIIGTQTGQVHISIFGIFICAEIQIQEHLNYPVSILSTEMSEDLTLLYVTVKDNLDRIQLCIIETTIFKTHSNELFAVASKHANLKNLVTYLTNTLNATTEAWESILLEMDSKLSSYAANVPEGTVSADFLELLMFGTHSTEMEQFLIHDLTEKGLKKMGHSIEISYANIQKLLLKHLTKFGQNITYHLAELRGMARHIYRYQPLDLDESLITKAILANGAFLVKSVEMQQVINHSMINYKAFFRWLYVIILRLTDEQIPPEIPKMTQQDLAYITEFLQNFDNIGISSDKTKKSSFTMERLGQYLVDAPLTLPPNVDKNIWEMFLEENECVRDDPSIVNHFRDMSLVQQHKHLDESINNIFVSPKHSIAKKFKFVQSVNCLCYAQTENALKFTHVNVGAKGMMFALINNENNAVYCLEVNPKDGKDFTFRVGHFHFVHSEGEFKVMDVMFYTQDILSVLLEESGSRNAHMCQLPASFIKEIAVDIELSDDFCAITKYDAMNSDLNLKAIEGMLVSHFAVSGSRRVSVVLAENFKKVRLFEMEAEEDEEEDADMCTKENDSLQNTSSILE